MEKVPLGQRGTTPVCDASREACTRKNGRVGRVSTDAYCATYRAVLLRNLAARSRISTGSGRAYCEAMKAIRSRKTLNWRVR